MEDAPNAVVTESVEGTIKAKIKSNVSDDRLNIFIDQTGLSFDPVTSDELKVLKNAIERSVEEIQEMGEAAGLTCYELGDITGGFAGLESVFEKNFYVRDGYNALLTQMNGFWQQRRRGRIVLVGNSGTGKSWYQIFVLRQLLAGDNNPNRFEFVIRQVGAEIFLIDLKECKAYLWVPDKMHFPMAYIIDRMNSTLYMYEPELFRDVPPMNLKTCPSLATLSPCVKRIAEYRKSPRYKELYFWPWSFSEMNAVAQDSNLGLPEDDVLNRHRYFGGVVRHVLGPDFDKVRRELEGRLANISFRALLNKYHDIDRDATGNYVSGYILCYDGFQRGRDVFDEKVLEYTSAVVKTKVDDLINSHSLKDKLEIVLKRLNDEIVDLSGKNLEAVGTDLLSRGSNIKWLSKRVGANGSWSSFRTTKREVMRLWDVGEMLRQPDKLLVSVNTNFPLADIVFSQPSLDETHNVIQFTWQESHPFTVRALYELRVRRLQIADTVAVNVYVVSPEREEHDYVEQYSPLCFETGACMESYDGAGLARIMSAVNFGCNRTSTCKSIFYVLLSEDVLSLHPPRRLTRPVSVTIAYIPNHILSIQRFEKLQMDHANES
ncbi:crinkler (CRN) family protein [Seminavis robusta]|uniref:Crinkler (CRN) family protein n=1 Tax=Seminavis robusta TaxID=568900 RepID=A0A9N8HAZ1_9STRA|nr:crinkler (CRN) family protein [Seminavis robusta]|eukprot:Sro315_g115430.1 crinkler (CRN) family protein (603) ;mRNA; r:73923-75925